MGICSVVLLAGCSSTSSDDNWRDDVRAVAEFSEYDDAQVDELAEITCGIAETQRSKGATDAESVDYVLAAFQQTLSDVDALRATTAIMGAQCPADIGG